MNFIFSCSTRYLTSERSDLVRYRVEHEKIKFVSTSGHVILCHDCINILMATSLTIFRRFPTTFPRFPKARRMFPKISRRLPKISEDNRRFPRKNRCSYHTRNTSEYFYRDNAAYADYRDYVKITCYFRVFHWCLDNNIIYVTVRQ